MTTRPSRGKRRRPDADPPEIERTRPRSGLSREEVANQRQRIYAGLAAALADHGYEDTKVTGIVELAGVSRATFYEHFNGKEACFAAAYEDGVERLLAVVKSAAEGEEEWDQQLSAGLSAGLGLLADNPNLAHLLLVEALAAARPARLEHERSLARLAEALRPPLDAKLPNGLDPIPDEVLRLLAGGLASHVSGRVLAGEAASLREDHGLLLRYLTSAPPASPSAERKPS